MTTLVTGGAGYIGSHTVAEFQDHGENIVVVDHLQQGHRFAVQNCPFYEVDIRQKDRLAEIMTEHQVDTVVHFAANSLVAESVLDPLKYYENNVSGTEALLRAMQAADVRRIVFSSTAAVYGEPEDVPIREESSTRPTNPYGETKLAIERMLFWSHQAYGIEAVCLRYFNAAGAHPTRAIGEDHHPETHLIPIVLEAALGLRPHLTIYGTDYPTPDGTCIRDYVHVMDLASAHRLAVHLLQSGEVGFQAMNLGIGHGFSVRQVISEAVRVTGRDIPVAEGPRRSGDPAVLVACPDKAKSLLGWQPRHTTLEPMLASAWKWANSKVVTP